MHITGINPMKGVRGSAVTISGLGFGDVQANSHRLGPSRVSFAGIPVTFTGTPAIPTSWTDTSIVVNVPAGAVTGNVIVTVADEAATFPFTVDEQ